MSATAPETTIQHAPDRFQQRVIDAEERSIRVVAPAGSGKTETLARRVSERIRQGVPAHRILVLTFDRNAAESFRSKLRNGGGPAARVETLNAYGYGLLRQRFSDERNRLVGEPFFPNTRYLTDLSFEYGNQVFSSMLSKIKNQVFDPRSVDREHLAGWIARNREHLLRDLENERIVANISDEQFGHDLATEFLAYEKFLHDRNGIDFDDQKLRPLLRLRRDSGALAEIQASLDEVIVDEFQDINQLDCELIDLISPEATLVVTGDDDQAIYGFRGASAEYLIDPRGAFDREFTHYELSINYRCPTAVLAASGAVIANNEPRIAKEPRAAKSMRGQVEVLRADNQEQEARIVARHAGTQLASADGTSRTAAILTRTNNQLLDVQSALIRAETPYRVAVANDIRVTWELARQMLLLAPRLRKTRVPAAEDRATIVGCFARSRNLPANQQHALKREALANEGAFPDPGLLQVLPERLRTPFTNGITALKRGKGITDDLLALEEFLNAIVSRAMEGGRKANAQSRLGGLIEMAKASGTKRAAFLKEVDRLISLQREALRTSAPAVELSTCHGAKGREWQVVFVPFCNANIFPDARSTEGEYLDAERKLFYVSMTRASEHLVLSYAGFRPDTNRVQEPSTFLVEAGLVDPPKKPARKASSSPAPWRQKPSPVPKPGSGSGGRAPRRITLFSPRSRVSFDGVDAEKVGTMVTRILADEERYGLPVSEMSIRYQAHDVDATLPVQLDLALRGVPFTIGDEHRFTESKVFQAMRQAWTSGLQPVAGSANAATITAMERILARETESSDARRWNAALERVTDEEPGTDPDGVLFTTV